MRKFERIYRELLLSSLREVSLVRQENISSECAVSIGLVNKTVKKLEEAMAVEATRKGVRMLSPARLLNLWATERDLNRDVWRMFRLDHVMDVERDSPRGALMTGFSGWVMASRRMPADYDRVYFYVTDKDDFDL